MFMGKFVFDLQRFEDIYNYNNDTLISGTKNADYFITATANL